MDRNGNGQLDVDELPGPMLDRLQSQGVDVSRGVSFEEFERLREGIRSEIQDFRRFGDRNEGGRDRRDGDGRGDRGRGIFLRDEDRDDDDPPEKKSRPRVTFDLPASHAAADTDRDGQLGMYEWRRWSGHSLQEFLTMDANGDGFVTPREVYTVIGFPKPDQDADRGEDVTTTIAAQGGTSAPADRLTAEATRYFGILDKDDDGAISEEEWGSSIRIRGMFEQGGLDLAEPMSEDLFVQNYVALSEAGG